MKDIDIQKLYVDYDNFKENRIKNRLFKPNVIHELVLQLKADASFSVQEIARSIENRPIYALGWGRGPIRILLWSQMHGDEPTATMAFMDLFNWLKTSSEWDELKNLLSDQLSLYFIPMLNPDGAARYQRRNAIDVDLNRDAVTLQCPESQALYQFREKTQPQWAFNMHDQRKYYTVGKSHETATISLLAPSFDPERSINEIRSDAMRIIVSIYDMLKQFIPGKIAKYTDKYYPRSFGDNFQKFGARSVLVESGGYHGDPEKQFIRKLHFCLLIQAFHSIATGNYQDSDLSSYRAIPENSEFLFDLIIRNATLSKASRNFLIDLAYKTKTIAHEEHWDFYHQSSLEDLGDLSIYKGFEEFDAKGLTIIPGKTYPEVLESENSKTSEEYMEILRQGYTNIQVKKLPEFAVVYNLPVRFIPENENIENELLVGTNPSIYLANGSELKYAVVNGFLVEL